MIFKQVSRYWQGFNDADGVVEDRLRRETFARNNWSYSTFLGSKISNLFLCFSYRVFPRASLVVFVGF